MIGNNGGDGKTQSPFDDTLPSHSCIDRAGCCTSFVSFRLQAFIVLSKTAKQGSLSGIKREDE